MMEERRRIVRGINIAERRKYVRIPDGSQITYQVITGKKACDYITRDLSRGGIRFFVKNFFQKDSILKIKLTMDRAPVTFEAVVKTAWVSQVPHSDQYEIGAQFIDMPSEAVGHLIDYIRIISGSR